MAGKSAGFAVSISAVDNATATLDKVNRRIAALSAPAEKFGRSVAKFGDVSGINRLSEGFHVLGARATDTFRSLDRIVPPLSAITGAASLAGMATLVQRWSQLGQATQNFARRVGVPTDRLTALRGAARLAGASAEDLDSGLSSLDEHLRGATFGRDPQATQLFNQLHVAFKNADGSARNAADTIGDIADAIAKLPRGAQLRALQTLGLDQLMPLLTRGKAGIAALEAQVIRLGGAITPEMAQRATDLAQSFTAVDIAAKGLANTVADKLEPVVKPLLDDMSTWIAKNRDWIASDIGTEVKKLADNIPEVVREFKSFTEEADKVAQSLGGWTPVIEGLVGLKVASWATGTLKPLAKLVRVLSLIPGSGVSAAAATEAGTLAGLGVAAGAVAGGIAAGRAATEAQRNGLSFDPNTGVSIDPERFFGSAFGGFRVNMSDSDFAGYRSMDRPRGKTFDAAERYAMSFFQKKGWSSDQAAGIVANLEQESGLDASAIGDNGQARGIGQWHPDRQAAIEGQFHKRLSDMGYDEQLAAYDWELRGPEHMAGDMLASTHGAGRAGAVVSMLDERPADREGEARRRAGLAAGIAARYGAGGEPSGEGLTSPDQQNSASRVDGHVKVDITMNGAPPGTRVTAQSSGSASASPPKVVTPMHGY